MIRAIALRLLVFIPSLVFASIVVFGLVYLIPGDPAATIAGPEASPEQVADLRTKLGLDRPAIEQYFVWAAAILRGDLGQSFSNGADVAQQLTLRLPVTFELTVWALLISLVVGLLVGVAAAAYRGKLLDRSVLRLTGLGLAVPEFWIGMLAISLFAVTLRWVPATGIIPWDMGFIEHMRSMILPAIVLAIGSTAILTRITRGAMVDVLSSTYVRTEWALGLQPRTIYLKLAFKNVAIPVVTVVGLIIGSLLGGAVFIERIFNLPGMGTFIVGAALSKDVPAIQASLLVVVLFVMLVNLVVDLSYAVLDPRTRGGGG